MKLLTARRLDDTAERVLFGLVANRALAPSSMLAAARWISEDVLIAGLPATTDDACYRAMDWLLEIQEQLEKKIYDQVADLLNLQVDLLFFDTTSTYFVTEQADEPVARDTNGNAVTSEDDAEHGKDGGFRTYGKSKDHRDDLPQVVIGMAVTRDAGLAAAVSLFRGLADPTRLAIVQPLAGGEARVVGQQRRH